MRYLRITIYLTLLLALSFTAVSMAKEVTVAVIDTGIDIEHPALSGQLWTNPGESGIDAFGSRKESNQVDDDANGWIDDVHGVDFSNSKVGLGDRHGHGTHISGLIAKNNPQTRIMSLKYYDQEVTSANLSASLQALRYAIEQNVDVINYSGGGYGWNQQEYELLKIAEKKNILVVAAAGNDGLNLAEHPFFPSCYPLKNIIPVAGLDASNIDAKPRAREIATFSNYGNGSQEFAAPAKKVWSSLPGGGSGTMSGTSQATAIISSLVSKWLSLGRDKLRVKSMLRRVLKNHTRRYALSPNIW